MNIRFSCPACSQTTRQELHVGVDLACALCEHHCVVDPGAVQDNRVHRCAVCDSTELFVRKDFPQRVGLTIVGVGLLLSCLTWLYYLVWQTYAILFASALIDVLLYVLVGNVLACYRCHAEYRGTNDEDHGAFDLEVHERHRQQAARLKDHPHESESGDDRSRSAGIA